MNKLLLIIISLLVFFLAGCKNSQHIADSKLIRDNKYDSEFPNQSISKYLEKASKSVKKLDAIAYYKTYYFTESDKITKNKITDKLLEQVDNSSIIQHETVSGTAFIIYNDSTTVGILSCAHTVDFRDTIFSYFDNDKYLIACSIKIKQQNHISGLAGSNEPIIVASDKEKDIAILMQTTPSGKEVIPLDFPTGTAKKLQWGSIIYTIGYPLGILMTTQSVVSINKKLETGIFVSDALYNQGISGSPVFAIRDGIPNFELIGMASSSSARASLLLSPDNDFELNGSTHQKYNGDIFVDNTRLINYGISYSITIDEIISFIDSNSNKLKQSGLRTEMFFTNNK